MSGAHSFSQVNRCSIRCRIELTFQVATRMAGSGKDQSRARRVSYRARRAGKPPTEAGSGSDREAGTAAARRRGVGIDHPERSADQVVDEIDLRTGQEWNRGRIDQNDGAVARNYQVICGLVPLDVELVLKARAAAAFDADTQHGAIAFHLQDFADAAGGPLADGDAACHGPGSECPRIQNI